jgi:hypothetical protein
MKFISASPAGVWRSESPDHHGKQNSLLQRTANAPAHAHARGRIAIPRSMRIKPVLRFDGIIGHDAKVDRGNRGTSIQCVA